MPGEELSEAQTHLDRIHAGIRGSQSRVRNVHVAQLQTDVVLPSKNVHPQRGLVHEIDWIRSRWNVVCCEESAAGEFEIGGNAAVTLKIPLKGERIESHPERRVRRLKGEKYRDGIHRVLEPTAQKPGEVRAGENPSVAQSSIERPDIGASAADRVSAAGPDLNFVATLFWARLCQAQAGDDQ